MRTNRMLALTSAVVILFATGLQAQQLEIEQVAKFSHPSNAPRRVTGGRQVKFSGDGSKMVVAFYGSRAQVFDVEAMVAVGELIPTAGDGEVGFVNNSLAYTADWKTLRLWDAATGKQVGDPIPHELREDTIIGPAISPDGRVVATRATMKSVRIWDTEIRQAIGDDLTYPSEVSSIRFSNDGKLLFVKAGRSLYAIDSDSGKQVAGPFTSGWRYYHDSDAQRLITSQSVGDGLAKLVVRATDQEDWPEVLSWDMPGKLSRILELADKWVFVQVTKQDYTPGVFELNLDMPANPSEVPTDSDRAFGVVISEDKKHWICSNIRNITCHMFGEEEPIWQMQVPASGYDQKLFPFNSEHFVIIDKEERFGVYRISDGEKVWSQDGVKRFSVLNDMVAICNTEGVELWQLK